MALEQEKKGGPYPKDERETRQKEVSRLHFEFGYSAIKIADLMKINRNTINEDIKYLYSNSKEELKQDSENFILRQMGRLEAQRSRIIENITEKKIDDIRYEKLLLDIDAKINNILLRINSDKQVTSGSIENQEDVIKNIILFLIIKHNSDYILKQEDIISEIVNMQNCTIIEANAIFSQMQNLGLECCRRFMSHEFVYDLLEFAYLRRYVSEDDIFVASVNALDELHTQIEDKESKLDKKYTEKYRDREKWTEEIFTKYNEEKDKAMEKYEEKISEVIVEALKNLSNQEQVKEYRKYINILFRKD